MPGFRAAQLEMHYFQHYTNDAAQMTDLPAAGREELVAGMLPHLLTEVRRLQTDRGDTIKFLWKLHDGALVESVLMRYPGRITLCVSSQAGCGMNCPFCATGQAGLTRNMSAAEIIEQVVRANRLIAEGGLGAAHHARRAGHQHRLHGDGRAPRQLQPAHAGGAHHGRQEARPRHERARHHGVDRGSRAGDPQTRRRRDPGDLRPVAARARRRPARRADPDQLEVEGRRGPRRRPHLLREDRPPRVHRVRPHQGHERPRVARRSAGQEAQRPRPRLGAREPDPAEPDPRLDLDRVRARRAAEFVRRLNEAGIPTTLRDTRGKEIDGACGQLVATEEDRAVAAATPAE